MVKQRITLLDTVCLIRELRERLIGLRVSNIYNLDTNSTFLLRLAGLPVSAIIRREKTLLGGDGDAGAEVEDDDVEREEEDDDDADLPPSAADDLKTEILNPKIDGPQDTIHGKGLQRTKELLLLESGCRLHLTRFERDKVVLCSSARTMMIHGIHVCFPPSLFRRRGHRIICRAVSFRNSGNIFEGSVSRASSPSFLVFVFLSRDCLSFSFPMLSSTVLFAPSGMMQCSRKRSNRGFLFHRR